MHYIVYNVRSNCRWDAKGIGNRVKAMERVTEFTPRDATANHKAVGSGPTPIHDATEQRD